MRRDVDPSWACDKRQHVCHPSLSVLSAEIVAYMREKRQNLNDGKGTRKWSTNAESRLPLVCQSPFRSLRSYFRLLSCVLAVVSLSCRCFVERDGIRCTLCAPTNSFLGTLHRVASRAASRPIRPARMGRLGGSTRAESYFTEGVSSTEGDTFKFSTRDQVRGFWYSKGS